MKRLIAPAALGLLLALSAPGSGVRAETPPAGLGSDLEELRKGQEEILRQIREIRGRLQPQRPAPPAGPEVEGRVFDLGANPVKGSPAAGLTLVEFTDYQ